MDELKPCPFCGGEPKLQGFKINGKQEYSITCENEGCGVTVHAGIDKLELVIAAWNTRA